MNDVRSTGEVGAVRKRRRQLRPDACVRMALRGPASSPAELVYGIIGILALKLAIGHGGKLTNQQGALHTVAHQPFGKFLLTLARDRPRRLLHVAARSSRARARPRGRRQRVRPRRARWEAVSPTGPCARWRSRSCSARGSLGQHVAQEVDGRCPRAGRPVPGSSASPAPCLIGIALYQGYRGITQAFLDDSKTEQMPPAAKTWIGRIGTVGHLARMVVFGLVGDLPHQGRSRLQPEQGGRPGRRAGQARAHRSTVRSCSASSRLGLSPSRSTRSATRATEGFDACARGSPRPGACSSRSKPGPGNRSPSQICRHHRRRLGRIGWSRALDPATSEWATGEFPPRPGNTVDVLIDGAQRCRRWSTRCAARSRTSTSPAGIFSPSFALERGNGDPLVLRNLLAELAERLDVRVLAWAGAPLPLFRPSRGDVSGDARPTDSAHEDPVRARCERAADALPPREDDRRRRPDRLRRRHRPHLGVGGDRFDTNDHPARADVGWHDALRANRRAGGRRRRRALPHALARGHRRAPARPCPTPEPARRRRAPGRAHRARSASTAPMPRGDFRILESYVRASRSRRSASSTSRTSSSGRPRSQAVLREKLADPPHRRLPARAACCRRSRTTAPTTRAACSAS